MAVDEKFGSYPTDTSVDDGDDWWGVTVREPDLKQESYNFIIESYETKVNPQKNSFGYQFVLVPYQDQYGMPVEAKLSTLRQKPYFYVGKVQDGKLYEVAQGGNFQTWLTSLDVSPATVPGLKGRDVNKWNFGEKDFKGKLVNGTVVWEELLSNRPDPTTGVVPMAIDKSNPYSYILIAKVKPETLRGVRDAKGKVKVINI